MGNSKNERDALDRLTDALVEDILSASDEEILAEFRDNHDPERHAVEMHALFDKSLIAVNNKRLAEAKAGVAANQQTKAGSAPAIDIAEARRRLRATLNAPGVPLQLTLAARKESELSDRDILGMLDDLRELGLLPQAGDQDDIS